MQIIVCKRWHLLHSSCKNAAQPKLTTGADNPGHLVQKAVRIMKLTAFFILATCLHVNATDGFGQKVTLSEREVHIEKIFSEIKKQTGFNFLYTSNILANTHRVTVKVTNALITEVLDIVLAGQGLEYRVKGEDNLIIIKTAPPLPVKPVTTQVVQVGDGPIEVRGVIVDENGAPAQNVNITVRGTNKGTTTNLKGEFVLRDVNEGAVLLISSVGYDRQEHVVKGKDFVSLKLRVAVGNLDEMQVIAYGTTSRRFSTGNIATVKAADIEKQPVQNPLLALQGRVPGIEIIQSTGLPGGGVTVRIQGRNSVNAGLDPLVVIDGVPFASELPGGGLMESIVQQGSPLNYINPLDIESIDILKDADATAIYGSRAANGAILITTKKGKAGRTKLGIGVQQGWGKVTRKVDMMNTRQYLDMRYEAFRNNGIILTAPSVFANDLKIWDTTRYTDWQKILIGKTAKYTNINASISGGTSAIQYLIGATFNHQATVFPGDFSDKQGTMHFNINGTSSNQRLKMQLTGNYSYNQNHLPGVDLTQQAVLMEPNAPALYNDDGTLNWAPDAAGNSTWNNPIAYTVSTEFNNTTKNLVSNAVLSYRLLRGLEVRVSAGYTNTVSEIYTPTRLEAFNPESRINATRMASFGNRNITSWIVEPQLQYTGRLDKSRIDVLLGSTILKSSFNYLLVDGSGFPNDLLMKTLRAANSISIGGSASGVNRFNALFGRLNYIWDEKYLLNLTARRDGSNKFGDKNKFHNFGSVGVGWIFSQERWMKYFRSVLSFGKLRSSYGITGNDQVRDFSYLSIYSISNPSIPYQNSIGLNATNIPNPYLQWEETRKWQAGIDLGFLSDRIMVGLMYARNRSSNQLIPYVLPSLTGFVNISKNLPAVIQNTSWEFTLSTVNIKKQYFSWSSSINFTIPRNRLVSFPGIEFTSFADGRSGLIVGQPLGTSKVYDYMGVNPANGRHLIRDKNDNPTTNLLTGKQEFLVSTLTKYYGGIVNNFSFNGFQLDFLIQFVRKKGPRDLFWYNGSNFPGIFSPGFSNQPVTVFNNWKKPGDNAPIPPYSTSNYSSSVIFTNAWYSLDASYIRLKNVSLSWEMPAMLLKKIRFQNARIFFQGQNLATISNYTGLDPETMNARTLPPLQMWTLGFNITL